MRQLGSRIPLLAALALPAYSQSSAPATTSHVFRVWQSAGTWYGKNIGTQPITGYVLHAGGGELHTNVNLINVAPALLEHVPIAPGQTVEIRVKPTPELDIPAVILADGTVLGRAVTAEGMDVVEYIFEFRRAEAAELQRLAVAAQHPATFQAELDKEAPPPRDAETSATSGTREEIRNLCREAVRTGHTAEFVGEIARRAAQAQRMSFRKAGVQ